MKKNGHCSAQDKYHFRKYPDLLLWLKAAVIAVLVILLWSCEAAMEKYPAAQAGYLASGFNADAPAYWSGGELCIYQSADGISWQAKYTDTYADPDNTTNQDWLRDPSIAKVGDVWLGVHTVVWENESILSRFEVIQSSDLQNWTKVATRTTSSGTYPPPPEEDSWVAGTTCWAPELFVDSDGPHVIFSRWLTLFSGKIVLWPYESHPSVAGVYTAWTTPVPLEGDWPVLDGEGNQQWYIDPFIIKDSGTYYLFYKDDVAKYICLATSTSLTTGYTVVKTGDWAGWGSGFEGPSVVKLPNGKFRIYLDNPTRYGIYYSETDDILNGTWSAPVRCTFPTADGATQHPTVRRWGLYQNEDNH